MLTVGSRIEAMEHAQQQAEEISIEISSIDYRIQKLQERQELLKLDLVAAQKQAAGLEEQVMATAERKYQERTVGPVFPDRSPEPPGVSL